jgi:hypothetical protein
MKRRQSMPLARTVTRLAVAMALSIGASMASGQVYKCQDANGKTIYSDGRCAAGGKSLKLPDGATDSASRPTVCAQLQDEMRRLAGEAARDAKRSRTPSATAARHRQTLAAQYHRRCVGITRSVR